MPYVKDWIRQMNENISKLNHLDCCGCAVCAFSCPVGAISMILERDGFFYPKVDEGKCIGCGKCVAACPEITPVSKNKINSIPSLESMFASSSQITNMQNSSEEKKILNSIDKNINSYKKLSDKFNDVLVNEVKKDLISKGIIE